MIRKMLYKSKRKGGGYTVSLIKPEGSYQVRWRLIAEEGRAITNGEIITQAIRPSDTDTEETGGTGNG